MLKHLLSMFCVLFISLYAHAQWKTDNLSIGRSSLTAAHTNGKIVFAAGYAKLGGIFPDSIKKRVDIYDIDSNSWKKEQLSVVREYTFAIGEGNKIYFAGYSTSGAATEQNKLEVLNMEDGTWEIMIFPQIRSATSMCSADGKIFFNREDKIDIYNTLTNQWTSQIVPSKRSYLSACACNGSIYYMGGGFVFGGLYDTINILNVTTNTWTSTTMAEEKNSIHSVCVNNKLFIVSGLLSTQKESKLIEIYDTELQQWTASNSFDTIKTDFSLTATNNNVYISGGYDYELKGVTSEIEVINGTTGEKTFLELSLPRRSMASIAVGDKVYFAGGEDASGEQVSLIDIYTEPELVNVDPYVAQEYKIFPNPVNDELYVLKNDSFVQSENVKYHIIDELGRTVSTGNLSGSINTSSLQKGLYVLNLTGETRLSFKFLK